MSLLDWLDALDVAAERWFQAHPWRVGALLALAAVAVSVLFSKAGVIDGVLTRGVGFAAAGAFFLPRFGVLMADLNPAVETHDTDRWRPTRRLSPVLYATTAAASLLVVGVIATLAVESRMPKAWEWMFGVALAASTFVVLFVLAKWRHDRSGNRA